MRRKQPLDRAGDSKEALVPAAFPDDHQAYRGIAVPMYGNRDRGPIEQIEERGISDQRGPDTVFVAYALIDSRRDDRDGRKNQCIEWRRQAPRLPSSSDRVPARGRGHNPWPKTARLLNPLPDIGIVVVPAAVQQFAMPG